MCRIRFNPQSHAHRRALEAVTVALGRYEIWVNEFTQPDGKSFGCEYILGYDRSAHTVGHFDSVEKYQEDGMQWVGSNDLSTQAKGLIHAHAELFTTL